MESEQSRRSEKEFNVAEAGIVLNRIVKLTNLLLRGTASKHYQWLTKLDEAVRASVTTPVNLTFSFKEGARGKYSVQANSLYQILTLLRDALLHMRYEECIEILKHLVSGCRVKMPLALETAIYRSGLEIMYNLSNLTRPPLADFVHSLRRLRTTLNPQRATSDQFVHTLCTSTVEEAVECISHLPRMEHTGAAQREQIALLYRAYKGLAHYLEFEKQRKTQESGSRSLSQSFHHFTQQQQNETLAEDALSELTAVTSQNGVWDMFIACQIELLEFLRRETAALKVLKDYKKRNENNPNSYRNLIRFYESQGDKQAYKKELEEYCSKWPSDKQACLQLIRELDITCDSKEIIRIYFSLLDYSCWRDDVDLWTQFRLFLCEVIRLDVVDCECLSKEWEDRKEWWMPFHFTRLGSSQLSKQKSAILQLLEGI
ncbi:TATA box-binding protein-associated factor RNA polymerase I subunit A-like [Watersipora subatra]|uniref:TATA box-binding protein-associated factor RNA polymerase I subunit A-like n=1 Tax=Watersipora subatra TaxID=2589382 RepID=UPI00355B8FF4